MNLPHIRTDPHRQWTAGPTAVGWVLVWIVLIWPTTALGAEKQVVHVYFADPHQPFLVSESRVMVNTGDPIDFGRRLLAALIDGSAGGALATLPRDTEVRAFFLLDNGTAVVDFGAPLREDARGGCRWEQLTLFSIVNTLVLNVAEISRVKILIDGTESQTMAGHLPLAFPLTADLLLTR